MQKAYDLSDLASRLKKRGLDVAEDGAQGVFSDFTAWFEESAKLSETPFDDMVLAVIPKVKEEVAKKIDLIDGQPG